jgi:hypothetical protein
MGDETVASTAATNMRNLVRTLSVLPARPTSPSGRTRPVHASAPIAADIDLGILAYMTAARDELEAHTRRAADAELEPAPRDAVAIYQWWVDNTKHLEAAARRVGEAMVYRQGLEHAIRARDTSVIRNEPCPSCGCYGLVWRGMEQRAVCVNDRDTDDNGNPRRFTLAGLAQHAVEKTLERAAT